VGRNHLSGDVLGGAGHGDAGVVCELGADDHGGVLPFFRQVDADAAARGCPAHALEEMDVVGRQTQQFPTGADAATQPPKRRAPRRRARRLAARIVRYASRELGQPRSCPAQVRQGPSVRAARATVPLRHPPPHLRFHEGRTTTSDGLPLLPLPQQTLLLPTQDRASKPARLYPTYSLQVHKINRFSLLLQL
jgi:hypothetical protein